MADPKTKEVLWYRPDPRAILPLDNFKVSKSLKKSIRNFEPHVSYNRAFLEVMRACGDREEGNWMTEDFFEAYGALHRQGRGTIAGTKNSSTADGSTGSVAVKSSRSPFSDGRTSLSRAISPTGGGS